MKTKLRKLLIEYYGTQIENHVNEVIKRLDLSVASLMYAGTLGDNPLCELNRAFNKFNK